MADRAGRGVVRGEADGEGAPAKEGATSSEQGKTQRACACGQRHELCSVSQNALRAAPRILSARSAPSASLLSPSVIIPIDGDAQAGTAASGVLSPSVHNLARVMDTR